MLLSNVGTNVKETTVQMIAMHCLKLTSRQYDEEEICQARPRAKDYKIKSIVSLNCG